MPQAALRRGAAVAWLACCVTLVGCAGAGGPAPAGAAPPPDGWYRGRQIPSSINAPNCRGRAREVWFEVENGAVEMRDARRRRMGRKRSLLGTVSADGSVAMRHGGDGRSVAGRIEGDRLLAATVRTPEDMEAVRAGGKAPCSFRYEATKDASAAPGAAAAVAPPFERFPQP
jgi:hypothetical protein